jgi:hypothetical protein
MTTGVIAVLSNSATISYTAPVDGKVQISGTTNGSSAVVSVNGVSALNISSTANASLTFFIGSGQTVTIANGPTAASIVSVLESN